MVEGCEEGGWAVMHTQSGRGSCALKEQSIGNGKKDMAFLALYSCYAYAVRLWTKRLLQLTIDLLRVNG